MARWMIGAVALLAVALPAGAQSLRLTSVEVAQPGDAADVCVILESGGAAVAGTQNDLVWDGTCATLASEADCAIAPDSNKELFGRVVGNRDFAYRGVVLSLSDVDPIADGTLYCCRFRIDAEPHNCCRVAIENAGMADVRGNAILGVIVGPPAQVCVGSVDGTPIATAMPTATPAPPGCVDGDCPGQPTDGDSADSDGCQTAAPRGGAAWLFLFAAALVLIRRR